MFLNAIKWRQSFGVLELKESVPLASPFSVVTYSHALTCNRIWTCRF